jgi:hypothetical protein
MYDTAREGALCVYISAEQLAQRTPWTVAAINQLIRRGVLVRGVHFFQLGPRGQRLFKWEAIVRLIESNSSRCGGATMVHDGQTQGSTRGAPRRVLDVEKATTNLQRLLD